MGSLAGLSVLLVEDEYLIALDAEQILKGLGVANVEIASTLESATKRIQDGAFDLAVLDVNLNGKFSYAIADNLRERGIPVVFASGYELRDRAPSSLKDAVSVTKPYTTERLKEALSAALRSVKK